MSLETNPLWFSFIPRKIHVQVKTKKSEGSNPPNPSNILSSIDSLVSTNSIGFCKSIVAKKHLNYEEWLLLVVFQTWNGVTPHLRNP